MGKDCCKMHQIFGLTCKQMVLIGMVELLHWTSSHGFHMFISLSELLAFRTRFFFFFLTSVDYLVIRLTYQKVR